MDIKNHLHHSIKISLSLLCTCFISYANANELGLQALNDSELSNVNGQALLSLSYLAPTDSMNKMQAENVGFYKLGMEADVELNTNIKKLQLGCGGINGINGCDIDINNLSLSGMADTRTGRATSSAKITNPFIEFAIKNPNSAAEREVIGFRLSADQILGLMTMGTENSSEPNGINSLSGFLKIKDTTGRVTTDSRTGVTYNSLGVPITGRVTSTTGAIKADFSTNDYSLNLGEGSGSLFIKGQDIYGRRMSDINLTGTATVNNIALGGTIQAKAKWGFITIPINDGQLSGRLNNLGVDVTVKENLGFIHKIPLNNPFSLSSQKQNVMWSNAEVAAQRGWWLAIEDSIDIGDVTPSQKVYVTDDVIKQVLPLISQHLDKDPIKCGALALSCIFGNIALNDITLQNSRVSMELLDLQLKNQDFAPNCYGNLRFC
ncbi:hypothetical protein [Acinetobacter rudis]|uniref:Uncharacterized protein n=1 Tax=Acinetobacter rudis CIP 110305 TaxID=421052 RepID=S3PSW5_9GAMM|nr:hypothetical protein [Acinetobacter rudis]EPF81816.1 hypothetical protein F945_00151 [Acinetobacter rudis CIP 110305]